MRMVVGEFFFLVTKSLKSGRLDLPSNHEICFQNFSSRNWRKLQISRFLFAKILFLFWNQKTDLDISLFSSRNSRYGFHIFLSLLDFTFWHLVNACFKSISLGKGGSSWRSCEMSHLLHRYTRYLPHLWHFPTLHLVDLWHQRFCKLSPLPCDF